MEATRRAIAQRLGEEAAKAMHAVITLEIQEIRPLHTPMEGAVDMAADTVVADTGEDLVEVDFMAEVLEDILLDSLVGAVLVVISEVDGTEEAVIGEDGAITRTEHMATPTSVFVRILTTTPTTLPGIGLRNVIPMAGATEFGYRIIEGKGYFLECTSSFTRLSYNITNRN